MSRLRVTLILNEGGEGARLAQLTDVAEEAEKFLRYLAADAGITVPRSKWVARNFENKSVRFDIEDERKHERAPIKEFNSKFLYCRDFRPQQSKLNGAVRHRTLVQFAKVADALEGYEKLSFGLYRPDEDEPFERVALSKRQATDLLEALTAEVAYSGTIHGTIHNIATADLWFNLRHSRSTDLVRCEFREAEYQSVLDAAKRRDSVVYVRGRIVARRVDRSVQKVLVDRVAPAPAFSAESYGAFFGADPNYSGKLSSANFIEEARRYDH